MLVKCLVELGKVHKDRSTLTNTVGGRDIRVGSVTN